MCLHGQVCDHLRIPPSLPSVPPSKGDCPPNLPLLLSPGAESVCPCWGLTPCCRIHLVLASASTSLTVASLASLYLGRPCPLPLPTYQLFVVTQEITR